MQPIFHNFLAVKPQGKNDSRSAGKLATLFMEENYLTLIFLIVVHIYGMNSYITKQF